MKKVSFLIISLLIGKISYSQLVNSNKYNKTNSAIIYHNSKVGLMDDKHNWVIKPTYDQLGETGYEEWPEHSNIFDSKGFLIASKNQKFGYIDEKEIVKIPFIYSSLGSFNKKDFAFASITTLNTNQEKFGVINRNGDWIIKPTYEDIRLPSVDSIYDKEDYFLVKNNNKWGFININNTIKIPFIFEDLFFFDDKGFAIAYTLQKTIETINTKTGGILVSSDNKCGIIDRNGGWVVPAIYDDINPFSTKSIFDTAGFLKVISQPEMDYKIRYIDSKGNFIKRSCIFNERQNFENNLIVASSYNGKRGIMDRDGKWVVPAVYNDIGEFFDPFLDSFGFIKVEKNKKLGFINIKNEIKIPFIFDYLTAYDSNNYSIAGINHKIYNSKKRKYLETQKKNKWGIINRKGKWVLKPEYDAIYRYRDTLGLSEISYSDLKGFLMVMKNNKWGFVDKDFKVAIPFNFDELYYFDDKDFACACKIISNNYKKKCGFINRKGEWVIEPKFELLRPFNRIGIAEAVYNERKRFINRLGEFIPQLDYPYDELLNK
jgi:hypothetical protein